MTRSTNAIALLLVLACVAPAQLVPGDIGLTSFFTNQFTLMHADGSSVVIPLAPGFGGISHAIQHDPTQPQTFIVGGVGFLGRITMTSASTATYAPITNAVGLVSQISFDGPWIVIADGGTGQMDRVDPGTGTIVPMTTGPQPWTAAGLFSGWFDESTGDIFAGGDNAVWRIPSGTSTPVVHASGWAAGSSVVTGLITDPVSHEIVATLLTVNRVARISAAGGLTDLPTSTVSGPNALDCDDNHDFVIGASLGAIRRVPNAGGPPVLIGNALGMLGAPTGVAVVRAGFSTVVTPGSVGNFLIEVLGVPAGTVEGFTVASFDVSLPAGTGPLFGLSPDIVTLDLINLFPVALPGNLIHWTWPVAPPLYPASGFMVPAILPLGVTFDLLSAAITSPFGLHVAPVVRYVVN